MNEQDKQEREGAEDQSNPAGSAEPGSVGWRDIFDAGGRTPARVDIADEYLALGETEAKRELQQQTNAVGAITRANELFVGPQGAVDDSIRTYVAELPQWFRAPERIDARISTGDDVFETDGFRPTADPLTAEAHTRTGTAVSLTVACTDQRPSTGQRAWLAGERELAEAVVSLIKDRVDRWEIDSLNRVSDGIAVLDSDLEYTYVNQQAARILRKESEELCGESVRDTFLEGADTVVEEKVQAALETQSPTSLEQYDANREQWIEATIHPDDHGVVIAFSEITDSKVARRKLDHVLETTPTGIVLLDASGEITRVNSRAETLLGRSRGKMDRKEYDHPDWDIWDAAGNPIQCDDHPVSRVFSTGETVHGFTHGITLPDGSERWLSSNVAPVKSTDGSIEQVIVALEDVTASRRLEQLTKTFQSAGECLNRTTSAEETEQTICELLTETRAYQYARIIEYTPGMTLTEANIRGRSKNVAADEWVTLPMQSQTEVAPAEVAVETGEIQVVTKRQPDPRFERWRAATLNQGFHGGAIVPLENRGRVHGLLVLYTDRGEALGRREQTLLRTFGGRVGRVFHSLATERVLDADTVAELTFASTDSASFFVAASEQLDCTIEIERTLPAAGEMSVHYASVQGASVDALADVADTANFEAEVRQIRRTEQPPGGDVEIELRRRSLAQTLAAAGAVVTTDTVSGGRAHVVCEVPLGDDIRSVVTRATDSFPETTLVSKSEHAPSAESDADEVGRVLQDTFEDELTDRQQQILRAAVYGGYFRSPRERTATEIADALSLTQSTVSYHLRNAQQTLFTHLFDRL